MKINKLKEDIVFQERLRSMEFTFHSTWGLFSPKKIDFGTRLIIEKMEIDESDNCIDLGCGYGPIGLVMAKCTPLGKTYLVDKDFVAVEFSKKNAQLNNIRNCQCLLSNGFSRIKTNDFSLIASNLPANVGKEQLYIFLHDARKHLINNGRLYLVTISGLKKFIKRNLLKTFGNYTKIKQSGSYTLALSKK
jgi:16S rRNA (guanine1207-N2)-methyltransferase